MSSFRETFTEASRQLQRLDRAIGALERLEATRRVVQVPPDAIRLSLQIVAKATEQLLNYVLPELEQEDPTIASAMRGELADRSAQLQTVTRRLQGA